MDTVDFVLRVLILSENFVGDADKAFYSWSAFHELTFKIALEATKVGAQLLELPLGELFLAFMRGSRMTNKRPMAQPYI